MYLERRCTDMRKRTPSEVIEFARDNKAAVADLKFLDFPGTWQHFSIPIEALTEDTFEDRWNDTFLDTFGPETMTLSPIWGRVDFTLGDGSMPADFNAAIDAAVPDPDGSGTVDDADALPLQVAANITEDAGYNPPENPIVTDDFQSYEFNGWTDTMEPLWPDANLDTWTFEDDGEQYIALHTGDSSVDAWAFDAVALVLNDAGNIYICEINTTSDYDDNGINRFYEYFFDYPDGDDICGNPPVGSTFHAAGIKDNTLLVTLQSSAPVAPPPPPTD